MLYIALLHYPIYNKEGKVVTTAVANMDIHDITRLVKTYDLKGFYVVNPIPAQQDLVQEIIRHWREGYGATYNPSRKDAFKLVKIKANLNEVIDEIAVKERYKPRTVVTGANFQGDFLTFTELRTMLQNSKLPYLIIFGTGSGIAAAVLDKADFRLEPIRGLGDYNHLAVRSAVAIVLDRIMKV
jgi:hypothetical protein